MRISKRQIGSLLALAIFCTCGFVLWHQLRIYTPQELLASLKSIPWQGIALAVMATIFSYSILGGYDMCAIRSIGCVLPFRKVAMASFVSYAISNTVGFPLLSHAPLRYHFYSAWGLSLSAVSRIVAFCIMTGWIGLLSLSGIVLVSNSRQIADLTPWSDNIDQALAFVLFGIVALYLLLAFLRIKPLRIFQIEFALPKPGIALLQLLLSCADWLTVSFVLFSLLPPLPRLSYPIFVGVFMLAQSAGSLSQVPGGLGVFESAVIAMLSGIAGDSDTPRLISALIAYRAIYYLVPFFLATSVFGVRHLLPRNFLRSQAISSQPRER